MSKRKRIDINKIVRLKLMWICFIFILFMYYHTEKANAATKTQNMQITLDFSELDDPDFSVDYNIKSHISDEIHHNDFFAIKIISKQIIKRELDVEYTTKYTYMPDIIETGEVITIDGYKKGDELVQQIKDTLKAGNDRIEEIIKLDNAQANYIVYDVTFEYDTDDIAAPKKEETEIKSAPSKTDLNNTSAYLCKGETLQLEMKNFSKKITKIRWESDNKKIAKVSKSGKVTAVNYGSTTIYATVYAGGKQYYYTSDITVYRLKGFQDGVTKLELHRGEGSIELSDVNAWLDMIGTDDCIESYAIPSSRVKVDISMPRDNVAKIVEVTHKSTDGNTYLSGFTIETYRDGVVTITVSDKKTTCKLEIVIGTGVFRLDPVEAIQKNDFTGYEGDELRTLQTIRNFLDKNNMFSESMPVEEKIGYIVDYFIQTYKDERYVPFRHGTLYRTMMDGHGVCGDYSETVCFLLDCLGIKNIEEGGHANGGPHAWNKVEINGKWYQLDAFWCACLKSKSKYFLTENLWTDHVLIDEDDYYHDGDIPYINSLH